MILHMVDLGFRCRLRPLVGVIVLTLLLMACDVIEPTHGDHLAPLAVETTDLPFIKAAHWFGEGWPVNFWSTDLEAVAERDFLRIKEDGFNTIVLLVPWPRIAPDATSGQLDQAMMARLKSLMILADELGLMTILRISYAWDASDKQSGERLLSLWTDDQIYQGWLDHLESLWQAVEAVPGFQFAFFSWEDLWAVTSFADAGLTDRIRAAKSLGFDEWALAQYDRNTLAERLNMDASLTESVAVPRRKDPSFSLFLEYINQAWRERYFIPAQQRFKKLSMEIRIDSDPIFNEGVLTDWFHHYEAWDLPGASWITLYWSPAMGGANKGEILSPDEVMRRLDDWLTRVSEYAGPKRIFIGQFLVEDFTPGYEANGRLARDMVDEFLEKAAPILARKASGIGLWTWTDYQHNAIPNPQFFEGLDGWAKTGAVSLVADGVQLGEGATIMYSASVHDYHAPGGPAGVQFCVTARAVSEWGHSELELRLTEDVPVAIWSFGPELTRECIEHEADMLDYHLISRDSLIITEVASVGFVQASGMRRVGGEAKPIADAYRALNDRLMFQPQITAKRYEDGWMGRYWVEEIAISPEADGVTIRTHLPQDWPGFVPLSVVLEGGPVEQIDCKPGGTYLYELDREVLSDAMLSIHVEAGLTNRAEQDQRALGCVIWIEEYVRSEPLPAT